MIQNKSGNPSLAVNKMQHQKKDSPFECEVTLCQSTRMTRFCTNCGVKVCTLHQNGGPVGHPCGTWASWESHFQSPKDGLADANAVGSEELISQLKRQALTLSDGK